jgi:hypothetical protein
MLDAPAPLRIHMEQGGRSMEVARAPERNARISTAGPVPYVAIHREFFEPLSCSIPPGILLPRSGKTDPTVAGPEYLYSSFKERP